MRFLKYIKTQKQHVQRSQSDAGYSETDECQSCSGMNCEWVMGVQTVSWRGFGPEAAQADEEQIKAEL